MGAENNWEAKIVVTPLCEWNPLLDHGLSAVSFLGKETVLTHIFTHPVDTVIYLAAEYSGFVKTPKMK